MYNTITILSCGKAGVGKSTIGNQILTNNPHFNLFHTSKCSSHYGVTQTIQGEQREITLPNNTKRMVQYLDIPGVGDPETNIQQFVNDIKLNYQSKKINIALLLINSQDNRKTLQECFSVAFFKSFFQQNGLDSKQILYLVFTRWQEYQMTDEEISIKLQSLADDGLQINTSRIIKYRLGENNDLLPLFLEIQSMNSQQGYNFQVDLDNGLYEYKNEMDSIIGSRNIGIQKKIKKMKTKLSDEQNRHKKLKEKMDSEQKIQQEALEEEKRKTKIIQKQIQNYYEDDDDGCILI